MSLVTSTDGDEVQKFLGEALCWGNEVDFSGLEAASRCALERAVESFARAIIAAVRGSDPAPVVSAANT